MQITVSARHAEVSDGLRATVVEKISRLSRFLDGMDRAEVHFSEEKNRRIPDKEVCEVTLEGHGHHVRCKVAAPDGFAAIDRAVEKLEHQLHKLKTKLVRRSQAGRHATANRRAANAASTLENSADADGLDAAAVQEAVDDDEESEAGGLRRIVKRKSFVTKPMTPDEATLQMDLLGHDFFFFRNAENDTAAVVYRRGDGDYGLIEQAP